MKVMKKSIKILSLIAAAAMALSGCSKSDDLNIANENTHRVSISVSQPMTKTVIVEGETSASFKWSSDDASRFVVKENDTEGTELSLSSNDNYVTMTLGATFATVSASEYVYTATLAKTRTGGGLPKIPTSQTSTATSYDPNADVLISETLAFSTPQSQLSMRFRRPVVINKMTLKGLPEGETINNVVISSDVNITGYYSSNEWKGQAKEIDVKVNQTVPSSGQVVVYFVAMPVEAATLTVAAYSNHYSYSKTFNRTIKFEQNKVTVFSVSGLTQAKIATVFNVGQNEGDNIYEIASIFPSVKNGIKFTYEQGSSSDAPVFYSPFHWYAGSTVTISAGTTNIKGITINFTKTDVEGTITASTGSFSIDSDTKIGTWTGSARSVTFTTDKQFRFSNISVSTDTDGTETVVTSTPTFSMESSATIPQESNRSLAATTNFNNGTITYVSSNTSVATVDETGQVTGVAPGSSVITASIAGVTTDYYVINSVTANCSVTVTAPANYDILTQSWTGVSGTNYVNWSNKQGTYSSAVYAGNSAGGNSSIQLRKSTITGTKPQAPSGIITTTSGGNAKKVTVRWNSNTPNDRTITIYGKNTAYTSVGDLYDESSRGTVLGTIVCGTSTELTISGNYKYIGIMASNGTVWLEEIDIEWKTATSAPLSSIAVSGQTTNFTQGDTFVFDGTVTATYTDGSTADVTSSATCSGYDLSNTGTQTVTVSYTENGVTKTTSYTITVSASSGGISETITFSNLYSSNTVLDEVQINGSNFSIVFNKRENGTATQYYTNGSAVRWYGGGTLTVSAATGKSITRIKISYTQTANTVNANVGSYSLSNNTGTWSGNASSVVLTQSGTSGQCRIASIEVTSN